MVDWVSKPGKVLRGDQAVQLVEVLEGRPLNEKEKRVVREEGFATAAYYDNKRIPTFGVGQTGEYIKKGFKASFDAHEAMTRRMIPSYDSLPEYLQAELVQSTYRGDLGFSKTTRKLFNQGKYEAAAKEFLNHDEYKDKNTSPGIKSRIKSVSDAIRRYGLEQAQKAKAENGMLLGK